MHTATARAHPNIAFIKYWGNQNHRLRLPANGSLSMNLDGLYTTTTVTWDSALSTDALTLNGAFETGKALDRVVAHLDVFRARFGFRTRAHVSSSNNFPMGVGIASSASSSAALTLAAVAAVGQDVTEQALTILARRGSGSAARSIPAGFVEWHAADTDDGSYAESIAPVDHWELVDVIAVVSETHKAIGSTEGHATAETSDLQPARVAGASARLAQCRAALLDRDFDSFADVVEHDSNLMHAVMMTSRPPLFYWLPPTLTLMDLVRRWRHEGRRVCYTLDAGANVHCICLRNDADWVRAQLEQVSGVSRVYSARPGGGAHLVETT